MRTVTKASTQLKCAQSVTMHKPQVTFSSLPLMTVSFPSTFLGVVDSRPSSVSLRGTRGAFTLGYKHATLNAVG